jgi:hypothetical protein
MFDGNTAADNVTSSNGQGSVLFMFNSQWSIGGSILRNNRATGGGSPYYNDATLPLTESTINSYSNNVAPYAIDTQSGGSAQTLVMLSRPPVSGSLPGLPCMFHVSYFNDTLKQMQQSTPLRVSNTLLSLQC